MLDVVQFVVAVAIAIPLWRLYHKIFKVYYFNHPVEAVVGELIGALVCGFLISELLFNVLGGVMYGIGQILYGIVYFVFNFIFPIISLWLVIALIWIYHRKVNGITTEPSTLEKMFYATIGRINAFPEGVAAIIYVGVIGCGMLKILFLLGLE